MLLCPHCNNSLRYINCNIVKGECEPVSQDIINQEEKNYKLLNETLNRYKSAQQIYNQIKSLESICDNRLELENFINNKSQYKSSDQLNYLIINLSKIKYISEPSLDSFKLEILYKYKTSLNQLKILEDKYNKLSHIDCLDINMLNNKKLSLSQSINNNDIELKKLSNIFSESNSLKNSIKSYNEQYYNINLDANIEINYNDKKEKLSILTKLLDNTIYARDILNKKKYIDSINQDVLRLNNDISTLQKLKQSAINVECKKLEETVNTINIAMMDSLDYFFSEPINVNLKLYKTVKSNKTIKPGLNITIKYKGSEYESINQMSGGEGDRVSLALIISLCSVSRSPFLFLDECMTSFDMNLREECINVLKKNNKNIQNKIILCVDHGDVDGFYDRIIEV